MDNKNFFKKPTLIHFIVLVNQSSMKKYIFLVIKTHLVRNKAKTNLNLTSAVLQLSVTLQN